MPFKNFKTAKEAILKLIGEAKKTGVKVQEYDLDRLIKGSGEHVCNLLDEILNRELVR